MTTNKPIRVQIKPQIVARLEPIKPEHQTMATFINDILYRTSKGLTPYATLNLSSEQSSPEKTKEKKQESADKFSNIESINKNKEKKKIDVFASPNIKKEEPVVNHPASKVFKASDLDWPQIKVVDELKYVDTKEQKNEFAS